MKNKPYYILLLLATLFMGTDALHGQVVEISQLECTDSTGTFHVAMHIETSRLDVSCGGGYRLEIAVERGDTRLLLPEVLYLSRTRNLYEQRRELLSRTYTPESYQVFEKVKKNRTYTTRYSASIPAYDWMKGAKVTYRCYQYGCRGNLLVQSGTLTETKQPVLVAQEVDWKANPAVYRAMTQFLTPEVEDIKSRTEMLRLNLEFPVNDYTIRPEHANNHYELSKVERLMNTILDERLMSVRALHITGYASPEGKFTHNEFLAKNRSQAFERYIRSQYKLGNIPVRTSWVAEDWDGLIQALDSVGGEMPRREQVLNTIRQNSHREPDAREWTVKTIDNRVPYQYMLKHIYPTLRRIELDVDYVVSNFSDTDARELIFTRPELLSLNEIFRVARLYEEGSETYNRVYRVATEQFPKNVIANNNMAAALLRAGDAAAAYPYLQNIVNDPRAYVNIGVYYYIAGDPDRAAEYFAKAEAEGITKGSDNLKLMQEAK